MRRSCLARVLRSVQLQSRAFTTSASAPASTALRADEPMPELQPYAGPTTIIDVPSRLLMGPGPANSHPRVLAAQSLPLLDDTINVDLSSHSFEVSWPCAAGHMHPPFFKIMDEIQAGLRYVFQTNSKHVLLISGTGHAGMEACIANLVEPGETVVVGNNGIWGARVVDMAGRFGAKVVNLEQEAGKSFSYEQLKEAVEKHKPAVLFLCQGESSTGVHQSLAGLGDLCRANGTLLLVDTVCSLGGVPMLADEWGIDAIYSGSQKVLAAPPGGAPLFFGPRAVEKLRNRKSKVTSYNLDLNLIGDYWGWFGSRSYHHTGMVSMWYAMREALALVGEEGLEPMWERHQRLHEDLWKGLRDMGLEPFVQNPEDRLATVNTIKVPEGVDWAAVVKNAMDTYSVEIAGGLGPSAGKVWRVGIMGYNAKPQNVALVLEAFRDGLRKQGKLK